MVLPLIVSAHGCAQSWTQWGQNSLHTGAVSVAGQKPSAILAEMTYDPLAGAIRADLGALLVHYMAPIVDGGDVFMLARSGEWRSCAVSEPPCGTAAWSLMQWGVRRLHWEDGALVEKWTAPSGWKPAPDGFAGWEPVFHPALRGEFLYLPDAGGAVLKLNREDGSIAARIQPFDPSEDAGYVAGPLTVDAVGNVFYNAIQFDPAEPWRRDVRGAWVVRIAPDDSAARASFKSLTPGAPAGSESCDGAFPVQVLPWPPSPLAPPPVGFCGSQRPGINVAPAVALDGTIYTVSRAHFNSRYAYVVAVNPDLTPKWTASLRDRLNDGCGVSLPPNGAPGGCREGARLGVDPATNRPPAGRVEDTSSASPTIAPDGSVLYGAYTRYNYSRGHLFRFSAQGEFLGAYGFGWDTTPAVYEHDGTYSVIIKENHYGESGSYCNDPQFCPTGDEQYLITSLNSSLEREWTFRNTNTEACERLPDGSLQCEHEENGFEWCINMPAVDKDGVVYANAEDGNLYAIGPGGELRGQIFLHVAIGAAYTPMAIGSDGRIYTQNDGRLFVAGEN